MTFIGSNDPRVPVGLGWLRASHRKLDPKETKPYRPYHTHDELWPLKPGEPVELDIEILPTSIVVPKGYRLALSVRGKDYEVDGTDIALPHAPYPMKGVGPFTHTNPHDRPPMIFGGKNTLHFGGNILRRYVLLPVIPRMTRCALPIQCRGRCALRWEPLAGQCRTGQDRRDPVCRARIPRDARASAEDFCREKKIPLHDRFEDILVRSAKHRRCRAGHAAQPARRAGAWPRSRPASTSTSRSR